MQSGVSSLSSFPLKGRVQVKSMRGVKLLLLSSAAGYSIAIGFTVGRWLLKETGELLLLFHEEELDDIDNFFATGTVEVGGEYHSCANEQHRGEEEEGKEEIIAHDATSTPLQTVGHIFLSIASSPILRAATLLIFVLSSTALLVGVFIIVDQFQHIKSRMLSSIENSKEKIYRQVLLPAIDGMDQLILDDVLQIVVKRGMEMWFGMCGGVLLYSMPPLLSMLGGLTEDEDNTATIFSKEVRRRILCATDPLLERVVFHPGGVWEMISPNWRDYLVKTMAPRTMRRQHQICNMSSTTTEVVLDGNSSEQDDDDDDDDDDDASFDTPLVSSVPLTEMTSPTRRNDTNCNIHHPVNSRQTIQHDLLQQQRRKTRRVAIQSPLPTTSPPPPVLPNDWHLERILQRTSFVTTILFVYHLHRSPNTRKAWGYMIHSLTSLGLVSTAVSAGLASLVLQSNPSYSDGIVNPIMNVICATVMGRQRWNNMMMQKEKKKIAKGEVAMKSIRWMFHQLRNEIQRKKRYYLAVLILYGMSSLSRRRRIRSRGSL